MYYSIKFNHIRQIYNKHIRNFYNKNMIFWLGYIRSFYNTLSV